MDGNGNMQERLRLFPPSPTPHSMQCCHWNLMSAHLAEAEAVVRAPGAAGSPTGWACCPAAGRWLAYCPDRWARGAQPERPTEQYSLPPRLGVRQWEGKKHKQREILDNGKSFEIIADLYLTLVFFTVLINLLWSGFRQSLGMQMLNRLKITFMHNKSFIKQYSCNIFLIQNLNS